MTKILNLILLNDWEPKKFLRIMAAIHIAMLGAIGLDYIGIELPILRQVIGFVYLTFVPGIIILKLLKIHRLGLAETVLLSIGLSISFLMFSGFFLNTILSFLKVESPLSFWHVIIFITALVTLLCILSYKTDKFYQKEPTQFKITRSVAYLILLPALSIVGTYLVNFQKNNIVLMVLIVLITLIPVLVILGKIPSEQYPLAVFVIAVSLLLSYSLISTFLTGQDIQYEYYFHKLVINGAFWNSEIKANLNAMLTIVILPAIYSYFMNMDGAWVFKIVYPIIFSLVPVGLYYIYRRQIISDKIAFFSVFFFMSFITFFTEMLGLARQQIAELFFVLLFFLTVNDTLNKNTRNILLLIFGASLVTSHYGLSYIYMGLIIFIYLFSIDWVRILKIQRLRLPDFNLSKSTLKYFVGFYIVFILLWYINFSGGSVFGSMVHIVDHIYVSIYTDFFNPQSRDDEILMAIGLTDPIFHSLGREVYRDLQFITQIFIIIGVIKLVIEQKIYKIKAEYFYLFLASFVLLLLSIILPDFASRINITRIYHITLFALSPLFVIGGFFVIEKSMKFFKMKNEINRIYTILIIGVMIPYFLFNTGLVYEMTNDVPNSLLLGSERMRNDNNLKVNYYTLYIPEQDVYSARWYSKIKNADKKIIADRNSRDTVLISYGMVQAIDISTYIKVPENSFQEIPRNYYLYLRKLNVCDDTIVSVGNQKKANTYIISPFIIDSAKVYSNGCGEIYEK